MEIWHIGHSCFKIKGKNAAIVIDPYNPEILGKKFPATEADVVLITHDHQDHNNASSIKENPIVFRGPGEYEVKGAKIYGFKTFHDAKEGAERGENIIYQIIMDGINLLHLGDLGHRLKTNQIEEISTPDILFIPVGGTYTIDANIASEIVANLEPRIIIPMHYREEGEKDTFVAKLDPVTIFIKRMGKENIEAIPKLHVTKDSLPAEPQVIIIN